MRVLAILLIFNAQLLFAQETTPLQVQFQNADLKLYSDVVNNLKVDLLFASGKHPRVKFQAIAKGATILYNDEGLMRILPNAPEVRLRVYAEIKDKIYWAGDLLFKCVPPPPSEGLKRTLGSTTNFTLAGKDVIKANDIFVDVYGGPVSELTANHENRVALSVTQKYDEYYRRFLEDYEVKSDDAEVKKVSLLVYTVKPKPGAKSCKLIVSQQGEKVGEVTLPVAEP